MEITIVGAGAVGASLARGWSRRGHRITFAVRDPAKVQGLLEETNSTAAAIDTPPTTDVVVLATPFAALNAIVDSPQRFAGKIVVDATNPLAFDQNGPRIIDAIRQDPGSGGEWVAARLPAARVVKAFNTHGAELNEEPEVHGVRADAYVAGDDAQARGLVGQLAEDLGFALIDLGPLQNARIIEAVALLWIHQAMVAKRGRELAVRVVR